MIENNEIWKELDIDNYEASNLGRIRNKKTKHVLSFRIKEAKGHKAYYITLYGKAYIVHRLIAKAFLEDTGINPDGTVMVGKHQVNHKDENPLNNNILNLEWCDNLYNSRYGTRIERCRQQGINKNPHARKVLDLVNNIEYSTIRAYAKSINVNSRKVNNWLLENKFPEGYNAKYMDKGDS